MTFPRAELLKEGLKRPWIKNFLIYVLPVIVGEIILGRIRGDTALLEMMPAAAIWGITGRIQALPIAWLILLVAEPALEIQYDGAGKVIWIMTAIGGGAGLARMARRWARNKKEQPPPPPPWCRACQKEIRPVRTEFPIGWFALTAALAAIPGYLWGWVFTLPALIFAIRRLSTKALCPECRQPTPGAKIPFDREAAVMYGLLVLCIGGSIGTHFIGTLNQPSPECAATVEAIQQKGGPNLWTADETEIDRWLEEDPDAWELLDEVENTCWQE